MMIGMVTQIQFIGILEIMKGSGGHLEKKKLKKYKYDGEIDGSRNRARMTIIAPISQMVPQNGSEINQTNQRYKAKASSSLFF